MPGTTSLPPGSAVSIPGRGRAWVWDTGGAPDRPTVLLLHGWTSTAALNWCRCFAPLGRSWRVVALDHRGHGRGIRSTKPFRLEDCADDAAALVDHLGCGPVVAVGYSMGGPVAQLLWRRHPVAVKGLVLCATALRFAEVRPAVTAVGVGLTLALSALPPAVRREGMRRMTRARPGFDAMESWAQEESGLGDPVALVQGGLAVGSYDARSWIGRVDVPTGVVITTHDQTVSPTRQRELAAAIPGAQVWEVPGGHRSCVESTDTFVPALLAACAMAGGRPRRRPFPLA